MNYLSAEQDRFDMILTQLGAKVQSIHGILCYVKFTVEDMEISYVYNVNAKKQYFLQRLKPYPLGAGVFPSQKEVIDYIKEDLIQFKNAQQSKVFEKFVDVNAKLHQTIHDLEELFLHYNVPIEQMQVIGDLLGDIEKAVEETKKSSPKISIKAP